MVWEHGMGGRIIHQRDMIEAYLVAFNEEETIHLSIKHYQQFCSRITILNNHSTDRTAAIAKEMGCRVRNFGVIGSLSDRDYIDIKNNCWKDTRYDWVIVADCDEILQDPTEVSKTDATIIKTSGWNVFSHEMPKEDWLEITNGHFEGNYSKTVMFRPAYINEINFHIGSHVSNPKGNVKWSDETLTLFHYRNVGGPQRLIDRHNLYRPRMSQENLQRNWGHHYLVTDEERRKEWEEKYNKSKPL
jgi:glycosyltransferase involved in cell wall biosynthesis